jgi:hypothetical protein
MSDDMSDERFFSISGVACVAHTPETRKKWRAIEGNKSNFGKDAIISYAQEFGYQETTKDVVEALNHLMLKFDKIYGAKSHIIREAIIHYS